MGVYSWEHHLFLTIFHGMSSLFIAKHTHFFFRDIHSHLRIITEFRARSRPSPNAYPGVMGMSRMIVIVIIPWWIRILWWIIVCSWDSDDNNTMMDNSNAKNVMDILGFEFILSYLGRTGFKYPMSTNQSNHSVGIFWSVGYHGIYFCHPLTNTGFFSGDRMGFFVGIQLDILI